MDAEGKISGDFQGVFYVFSVLFVVERKLKLTHESERVILFTSLGDRAWKHCLT